MRGEERGRKGEGREKKDIEETWKEEASPCVECERYTVITRVLPATYVDKSMFKHSVSEFCALSLFLGGVVAHVLQDGCMGVKEKFLCIDCLAISLIYVVYCCVQAVCEKWARISKKEAVAF